MSKANFATILLKSIVPYTYLLNAALVFFLVVISILLFVGFFLIRFRKREQKKVQLCALFSDLIAEITICESEDERQATLHQFFGQNTLLSRQPFHRQILIEEIVRTKDSLSGGAAENLRWLYETLHLDKDTLQCFLSEKWHRKARAMQHFAEMQQDKYLLKIYRETNSRNPFIRTEAQIAVVKLTGFKGLRFLTIISHPVSQWQQLSLISQLPEGEEIEEEKIRTWLCSKNSSVVEFALRLAAIYKCYDLHDPVVSCLKHASETVRLQALQVLKEIANESTAALLIDHFSGACKQEQIVILDLLMELDAGKCEMHFLTSLLKHTEEAVRYRAMHLIQQISPAASNVEIRQIKNIPSPTYLLSMPEKKAV